MQLTVPICLSQSNAADTVLSELQNGQLKNFSSFGFCFFGGGLLLFRLPMLPCYPVDAKPRLWQAPRRVAPANSHLQQFKNASKASELSRREASTRVDTQATRPM